MSQATLEHARTLELAQEVDRAVDQLWAAGNVALVLRLLLEDCERLLGALRHLPAAGKELTALEALCSEGAALGSPLLPREVTPAHRDFMQRLASRRRAAVARLRGRTFGLRQRWALAAAVAVVAVATALLLTRNQPAARASVSYSSVFPARNVVDGVTNTEWLLPDGKSGWLEVVFPRPRQVESVRVFNSHNRPYLDRAAKTVKLEAFAKERLVASASREFPAIAEESEPLTVPLSAREVTHVRITVESFYGLGGGLAEVEVR